MIDDFFTNIEKKQDEILNLLKDLQKNGDCDCKDKVYDLTDLEDMLHVSRRTLFNWKSEGKLNFVQLGKKLYVTNEELKRFLVDNQLNSQQI